MEGVMMENSVFHYAVAAVGPELLCALSWVS